MKKTLHYSMLINAPRQRVWDVMLGPEGFKQWTSDFAEGSYYEGSWEKGQRIRFLTPEGEGMFSTIEENRPYEFVSIHHLGTVKNGSEDTQSEDARQWGDAWEKYAFKDVDGGTELVIGRHARGNGSLHAGDVAEGVGAAEGHLRGARLKAGNAGCVHLCETPGITNV